MDTKKDYVWGASKGMIRALGRMMNPWDEINLNFHPWKEDKFRLKSKGKIIFLFLARMMKERDVQCLMTCPYGHPT